MKTYHTAESLGLKSMELPAKVRWTFPRYIVLADGHKEIKTQAALRKLLSAIYADTPKVFVNAGKGITIDFDRV